MGKIKIHSLKWAFAKYIIPCILLSIIGILAIGHGTNYLQEWYTAENPRSSRFEITFNEDGTPYYVFQFPKKEQSVVYWLISYAQVVLMPLWTLLCVGVTGMIFYHLELRKPINTLMEASRKVSENQLDFQIPYQKRNELGMLCKAFDDMRLTLYENNREMWKSLEERKRLNAAFSHDLRTPLTVLKGYVDFLRQYVPDGRVPEEKLMHVLSMMNGQITRLEHYTQKMNTVQKLEDIVPYIQPVSTETLAKSLKDTAEVLCGTKVFTIQMDVVCSTVLIDLELVMQVYENMVSNAVRYAKSRMDVQCRISEATLTVIVSDDGNGFSDKALKNAAEPFFRDEKDSAVHFGLGLYICRLLCEKCGGTLRISNHEAGGRVTAEFFCG